MRRLINSVSLWACSEEEENKSVYAPVLYFNAT